MKKRRTIMMLCYLIFSMILLNSCIKQLEVFSYFDEYSPKPISWNMGSWNMLYDKLEIILPTALDSLQNLTFSKNDLIFEENLEFGNFLWRQPAYYRIETDSLGEINKYELFIAKQSSYKDKNNPAKWAWQFKVNYNNDSLNIEYDIYEKNCRFYEFEKHHIDELYRQYLIFNIIDYMIYLKNWKIKKADPK